MSLRQAHVCYLCFLRDGFPGYLPYSGSFVSSFLPAAKCSSEIAIDAVGTYMVRTFPLMPC